MADLTTKAFRAWPSGDEPQDIRPLTAGAIGAMIVGLGQARHDIERSLIEGARVMRLVTGEEAPPATLKEPEGFVKWLAESWLQSYGSYAPKPTAATDEGA